MKTTTNRIGGLAAWLVLSSACAPSDRLPTPGTSPPPPRSVPAQPARPAVQAQAAKASGCTEIAVHCGATPMVVFDGQGQMRAIFEQAGDVYYTTSTDLGATFTSAVPVTTAAETIETNGENRPKIALGSGGALYVSWTKKSEGRFTGDIRFSRSLDDGRSFEPVRTINDDGLLTGHRFDSLHVDAAQDVYLVWIDKRDREASKSRGEPYTGAAIYYTVSTDRGASFAPNRRVAPHACECCRIAIADSPAPGAAIFWRHIFESNIRDHAFAVLGPEGVVSPPRRATRDGWRIEGCPHHGPAMVPASESGYHFTWFTAAESRPAVYYGRFDPASDEIRHQTLVASSASGHPHLIESGGRLLVVWKEPEDGLTKIYLRSSNDSGANWSERRPIASTSGASDHPFLLRHGSDAFLSWHTAAEGLRIVRLAPD